MVCIASFQVSSISRLIYREEIPIYYPLLNILQANFRKLLLHLHELLSTHIIYLPRLKQIQYSIVVNTFAFRTRDGRSNPTRGRSLFYYFFLLSEIFRTISGFFEGSSEISQVIFLNFSGRLLINSKNMTDSTLAALKFRGPFLSFSNYSNQMLPINFAFQMHDGNYFLTRIPRDHFDLLLRSNERSFRNS